MLGKSVSQYHQKHQLTAILDKIITRQNNFITSCPCADNDSVGHDFVKI